MTSPVPELTPEEHLAHAIVCARLAGVHPDWIEWAVRHRASTMESVNMLQYVVKLVDDPRWDGVWRKPNPKNGPFP
jgi:hypothetical protein